MTGTDLVGWGAAVLTLLTFVCRDMRRLRLLALCANAAFVAYGATADLVPVLVLHLSLAPVNLWRLLQDRAAARCSVAAAVPVGAAKPAPSDAGVPASSTTERRAPWAAGGRRTSPAAAPPRSPMRRGTRRTASGVRAGRALHTVRR